MTYSHELVVTSMELVVMMFDTLKNKPAYCGQTGVTSMMEPECYESIWHQLFKHYLHLIGEKLELLAY
jgi:hypothetical protein